jgi:hypothetical protein
MEDSIRDPVLPFQRTRGNSEGQATDCRPFVGSVLFEECLPEELRPTAVYHTDCLFLMDLRIPC